MHMVSSDMLQGGALNGAAPHVATRENLALQRPRLPDLAAFADNNFRSGGLGLGIDRDKEDKCLCFYPTFEI